MTDNEVRLLLKERREQLGLNMKELAQMIGVSESTISRWETGNISNMRRDKISSLSKILNISPAVIVGLDEYSTQDDSSTLTPAEHSLLDSFRQLNPEGQEKVQVYTDDLLSSGKYIKSDLSEMVDEK